MRKKRVYLSGPVTGHDDFLERFQAEEQKFTALGYDVVNAPKINELMPKSLTYEECMQMCFTMEILCDYIHMMDGWEKSSGANRAREFAIANHIKFI